MQSTLPYILSALTFLPILGAIIVMLLPRPTDLPEHHGDDHGHDAAEDDAHADSDVGRVMVNGVALFFALLNFVLSIAAFAYFRSTPDPIHRNFQFMEDMKWISVGSLDIHYRMGVDGISMLLVLLTTFLMVLSVLYSFRIRQRLKEFMVFLLLLEAGMVGVFCALDLVLFYVFWEAMLIPMYFLIGIFGHENRIYAAIKFFLFTFAGSIFMLIAIVGVYQLSGTFDVIALSDQGSAAFGKLHSVNPQLLMWMFAAFALAFMIKVPMFPFHTWLPDAHVEAPTAGSVILAGVMLKMGTYGFLRFCLPLFPDQAQLAAPVFITLAIIGIVYGSIVAAVQPDAKKLVAYSSVAHLGFVILGIFTFTRVGVMGALLQNINHGISTPMLFFIVGMLYDRRHTRQISEYGGLKKIVPMLATMLLIATLASVAVPFFNGFVGEFPILVGSWISSNAGFGPTALAATGMILSAVYMLWWFQRLMLGKVTNPINLHLKDLTRNEWLVLTPLAFMVFWIGLNSTFWSSKMQASVDTLMPSTEERNNSDLPVTAQLYSRSFSTDRSAVRSKLSVNSPRHEISLHPPPTFRAPARRGRRGAAVPPPVGAPVSTPGAGPQ